MSNSPADTHESTSFGLWTIGILGTLIAYMIWIGVSGTPIPGWVYWISTVL